MTTRNTSALTSSGDLVDVVLTLKSALIFRGCVKLSREPNNDPRDPNSDFDLVKYNKLVERRRELEKSYDLLMRKGFVV